MPDAVDDPARGATWPLAPRGTWRCGRGRRRGCSRRRDGLCLGEGKRGEPDSQRLRVPRRSPERHRHPAAGSPSLRGIRHDERLSRRPSRSTQEVDGRGRDAHGRRRAWRRSASAAPTKRRRTTRARPWACQRRASPSPLALAPHCSPRTAPTALGIASKRPAQLIDLPHFAGDMLDPAFTGGDLCIQACADDPQVAVHAIRNLSRIAFGTAADPVGAIGVRPHVVHHEGAGHAAQSDGLQGRHAQPARGRRR